MDRGAWQATVRGVPRVGHNLVTKRPPPTPNEGHDEGTVVIFFFFSPNRLIEEEL